MEASIDRLKDFNGQHNIPCTNNSSEARKTSRLSGSATDESEEHVNCRQQQSSIRYQFPYEKAYLQLLFRLSVNPSPTGKLAILYELVRLVVSALSNSGANATQTSNTLSHAFRAHSNKPSITSDTQATSTPHTSFIDKTLSRKGSLSAMTSLGEAIATVEAKRITSGMLQSQSPVLNSAIFGGQESGNRGSVLGPNTDAIAEELRRIFKSVKAECNTLFRDLQFIAAFVPSHVLDLTDMGKVFWDVSLAALSLKEEYLEIVSDTASELFKYSTSMISPDMDVFFFSQWTLKDSAWLWSIAAKEGDMDGQRELAIMHLSHPELVPICLAPFTKLSETFPPAILDDYKTNEDTEKMDPIRMAIIKHWMEHAAAHGDSVAREYLTQQNFPGYSI